MDFNWSGYKRAIETEFTIVDKDKKEVSFILQPAQDDFIQRITLRNLILKARKLGFSSLMLAIASLKFIFGENERCVSMSFDADASKKQLERAKRFIEAFERKNGIKIPMKYNSKNEMVYERLDEVTGLKYVNTFRIGTAKTSSFGRGDDISFLHLTEVSLADNLEELMAGVGEAVVNNAITTLETTANGYNQFKTFWDRSKLGLTGYEPFFYGPEWEYDTEYLAEKKKVLGNLFMQEYPMTDIEAFISSGNKYFDTESLKQYLNEIKSPINL